MGMESDAAGGRAFRARVAQKPEGMVPGHHPPAVRGFRALKGPLLESARA